MSDPSGISLGGVAIPCEAGLSGLSIARGRDEARAVLTLSDGSAVIQERWTRATYDLSGAGWIPPGLLSLDRSTTHSLVYPNPASRGTSLTVTVQIISGPSETYDFQGGRLSWSVSLRATS